MSEFYLGAATYYVVDNEGNKVLLQVDYWNNKAGTENLIARNSRIRKLRTKAGVIGKNLLKKKHRVNFAYKYENL